MKVVDMPDHEYHAIEAFSNSGGGKLSEDYTPRHYKANEFKGSPATRLGTVVHARMLMGEKWDDEIKVWTGSKTLTSKGALKFIEDHPGFTVVTQEESDKAKELVETVESYDPHVIKFFKQTINEQAIIGEIEGVPVKCKLDAWSEKLGKIYDVKTTESLAKFRRSFYDLGYHRQAAWYLRLAQLAGLAAEQFVFFVVESSAPYCHKFVTVTEEVIEDGREDIDQAFEIYKECYLANDWSEGYSDDVLVIHRPHWRR